MGIDLVSQTNKLKKYRIVRLFKTTNNKILDKIDGKFYWNTIVGNCITELAPVKQFYGRQVGDSEYKFFVVKKSAFWTELATVAGLQ